jgi:hypothetical protein
MEDSRAIERLYTMWKVVDGECLMTGYYDTGRQEPGRIRKEGGKCRGGRPSSARQPLLYGHDTIHNALAPPCRESIYSHKARPLDGGGCRTHWLRHCFGTWSTECPSSPWSILSRPSSRICPAFYPTTSLRHVFLIPPPSFP